MKRCDFLMCSALAVLEIVAVGCVAIRERTCVGEWEDVFDATLSNAENGGAGWHYEADGCLAPTNAEKILTARSYGPDFDLDCTYRLDAAGNSGLYIYDSDHPKAKIEIQMLDDTHPQYNGKQKRHQVTGSLYGHSAATKVCSKPAGEWNRMQVACRGKSVKVWVNGELVIDEDLAKFTDAKTNPDGSLTPERQRSFCPWAEIPTRGRVGFQGIHGGGAVHVKSFKVREMGERGDFADIVAKDHKVISVEEWYGGRRIEFDFNGYNAWLVCPAAGTKVAAGRPWTWTMQWRTAFVDRTGASEMLRRGWHHAAIDTFKHRMDAKGLEVNRAFQRYLVERLGLKPKAALIGMSWGGFFSVRYAATYPDCVDRIYLDAPLLTFHDFWLRAGAASRARNIGGDGADWSRGPLDGKSWENDPRMPVNMTAAIAKARIPVLLLYGGQDQTVNPELNAELFIKRMQAAGGVLRVGITDGDGRGRAAYGHHPHGLDVNEQAKLADFFEGVAQ